MPVSPSPKVQLQVATPPPLVACAVKPMAEPTSAGFGLAATVTVNFALTVSETLLAAVTPRPSVAVTLAVNEPVAAYVWVVEQPVPVVVSPKAQLQVAVPTPPVVGAVKSTRTPTSVRFGLALAVTASLALTATVILAVAFTPRPSVAVTVALNVPVLA